MLKRFLITWRFVRDLRYSDRYAELPWDKDDAENLQRFMLTATGAKFRGRLRNFAISKALEGVTAMGKARYHAGKAFGVQITNLYIDQHLPEVEKDEQEEPVEEELNRIYG